MSKEIRKQINMVKNFDKLLNENIENLNVSDVKQRFIYLLSSDGHRDSVSLDKGSLDIDGLKKLLVDEQKEDFGHEIIEDSIKVDDKGKYGWLYFKYKDYDNEIEDDKCGFFKLKVV